MSVNEVKYKSSGVVPPLTILGPDPTARTFFLGHQDHTLGNAVRHVLLQGDADVEFAGYSVPHPAEPVVQIRVQTQAHTTANACLKQACATIQQQCDVIRQKLEERLPYVRDDRLHIEQLIQEQIEEEDEDQEGDAMEMG